MSSLRTAAIDVRFFAAISLRLSAKRLTVRYDTRRPFPFLIVTIEQVRDAVSCWQGIAKDCGVRKNHIKEIESNLLYGMD